MLIGRHPAETDATSLSRMLHGLLSGMGFFGGAVILKSGRGGKALYVVKTCIGKTVEVVIILFPFMALLPRPTKRFLDRRNHRAIRDPSDSCPWERS